MHISQPRPGMLSEDQMIADLEKLLYDEPELSALSGLFEGRTWE